MNVKAMIVRLKAGSHPWETHPAPGTGLTPGASGELAHVLDVLRRAGVVEFYRMVAAGSEGRVQEVSGTSETVAVTRAELAEVLDLSATVCGG